MLLRARNLLGLVGFIGLMGVVLLTILIGTAQAHTITVAWRDKPPHQYLENGQEKGVLLELTHKVFSEAGLSSRFVEEPAKRIWQNFANKTPNYCSFGWYKIPERESLVQFSEAMYRDPPHTLLVASPAMSIVSTHTNLKSVLSDSRLTLAIVDGVSYGEQLDQLLASSKNKRLHVTASPAIMVRMINANRASMLLIDREDWHYLRSKDASLQEIHQVDLEGMPAGLDRYIICSKDLAPEIMMKINLALAKLSAGAKRSK